jgi:NAD+ synthase (glutamine-hydrolysing)
VKIGLLQLNLTVGDLVGNAQRIERSALACADQGVQLAVTSELALFGYPPRDLLLEPAWVASAEEITLKLAQSLKGRIKLLLGAALAHPEKGRPMLNAVVFLDAGQVKPCASKMLLPTYDVFDEDRYFEPALQAHAIEILGKRFGVSICEDIWNDGQFWPIQRYERDPIAEIAGDVDLLVNLSSSPFYRDKQVLREKMIAHTARRHGLPVVYVNQIGGNDELIFDGRSGVFGADGTLIARAKAFEEDILVCDLDTPQTLAPSPTGEAEIWEALVLGTRDYAHKCGFAQGLVALSGGIDSALTVAIVAEALGSKNLLSVMMPSPYSSSGSIDDSLALAAHLGIETLKLPIAPAMAAYEDILAEPFAGLAPDITEENLQARIRGNLIMALSNKLRRLVFTTGNKSEIAVGYSTLYGDTAGALGVIGDLFKTEVYQLARWINRNGEVIPEAILTKAPSAELKPDQRDQDTLPPYEILDAILRARIESHQSAAQIVEQGFDPAVVERVLKMVRIAEFKRSQLPPALKVSSRAFGLGWQMPIARR